MSEVGEVSEVGGLLGVGCLGCVLELSLSCLVLYSFLNGTEIRLEDFVNV